MAKRTLLLGRAGSGKTRFVLDRLAGHIRAGHLRDGRERPAVLLVPTLSQASHLKRLLLSRHDDVRGFFDESILTFTGLAERLLVTPSIGDLLSGLRQDLFLRGVLEAGTPESGTPESLRKVAGYPGFRRAVVGFVKEVKQNGLPWEETLARIEEVAAARPGAAGDRLLAFREVFAAYETRREAEGLLDHEDYLRGARDHLRERAVDLDLLAVDGFQNFTRLERELILSLAEGAEETIVTLPWDSRLDKEGGQNFRVRQFKVAEETRSFLLEHGFARSPLDGNHRMESPALAHLERCLFAPGAESVAAEGSVREIVAADPEDEADRIARIVRRLAGNRLIGNRLIGNRLIGNRLIGDRLIGDRLIGDRLIGDEGYRWRDVVVVLREVGGGTRAERYEQAFARHGVPLFVHGSRPLSRHPYVRSVLHLLKLAAGITDRDRVLALLRSDHVRGVSREEVDLFEDELCRRPERFDVLADLAEFAAADRVGPPREIAGAAHDLIERWLVPLWERDLSDAGPAELGRVRAEASAAEAFRRVFDEVANALGSRPIRLAGLLAPLNEALGEAGYSVRDRRLDVVNLIGAREARQWEAPVVIVAGLTEGEFPRNPREDVFLPDEDRRWANDSGRLALKERSLDREEERYLVYVALTRARERLYLAWPSTDGGGGESLPSLFLTEVRRLFTDAAEITSVHRLSDPLPLAAEVMGVEDLRRRALLGLGELHREGTPEAARAWQAAALHDLLVDPSTADSRYGSSQYGDTEYRDAARLGARFLRPPRAVLARPKGIVSLRRPGTAWSPTALETWAQCRFQFFAGRLLRLEGPPADPADGLDILTLGTIAHEVLRRIYERAAGKGVVGKGSLPRPEDVDAVAEEVLEELASPLAAGLEDDRARRELLRSLREAVRFDARRLADSEFRPSAFEVDFGRLEVAASDGTPVRLQGRIDRVDVEGGGRAVIIDYKYSKKGFDKSRERDLEEGAHFQLPVYLLAARDALGLDPRAAWLLTLKDPKTSGLTVGEGVVEEGIEDLLGDTVDRVAEIEREMRAGSIVANPRDRRICEWCDFSDLCRFEPWMPVDEGRVEGIGDGEGGE